MHIGCTESQKYWSTVNKIDTMMFVNYVGNSETDAMHGYAHEVIPPSLLIYFLNLNFSNVQYF